MLNGQVDPAFKAPYDWVTLAARQRTDEKSSSGSSELHYAIGALVMTIINDGAGRFVNISFGTVGSASPHSISVHLDHNEELVTLGENTWEVKQHSTASGSISSVSVGTIKQFPPHFGLGNYAP